MQQQAVLQDLSPYAQDFQARRKERMNEPVWLIERRQAAMAAFEATGFPTRKDEAWRNLDLTPIRQHHFETLVVTGQVDEQVPALKAALPEALWLVFVDGRFHDGHSDLDALPAGLEVRPMSQVLSQQLPRLPLAEPEQAFGRLNTAYFEDAALIRVARGVVVERPVAVAWLSSEAAAGRAIYPRTLVQAEAGAQLSVAEFYQGGAEAYLSAPVSEIHLADNAMVEYTRLQEEGAAAFHLGSLDAHLERDARLRAVSLALGGRVGRLDVVAELAGTGAEASLEGLYISADGQYLDHHTTVRHLTEHGRSHQRFKGVLSGKSETVYDGLVQVAKGAQKTDARQENRNLLLSKRALAHSNPRLEIFADDVKCSHGSTVGQLDQDALFYLRSRGIGPEDAQGLMTIAFVAEVLDTIGPEPLRRYARGEALAHLPGDATVKELA